MKKVNRNIYLLLFVSLIMIIGLTVSCKDNDDSSNAGKVELLSFGPCPIPRGGELRIIGKNLDQVESVVIPGSGTITDFTMKTAAEIRIIVPKSAEEGQIALNAKGKVITSITNLTIYGSILLNDFTPLTAKAGDIIKLEGEDLDFADEVLFTSDVHVLKADFVSQSREAIEVKLPIEAQSGKVALSGPVQGNQVSVYYENELNVVLPTITSFSPGTIRAGAELTITGKDFDLVKTVTFGGDKDAESFAVNDEKTVITVTVPDDAQDGAVVLTAFSGVKVSGDVDLVLVVPTISTIEPNPVKAGDEITVTGTDLDLVSKVTFGTMTGDITKKTATEIKVKVPDLAKSCVVTFTTLAGKTVESDPLTIVGGNASETVIWEGSVEIGWGSPVVALSASDFVGVPAGAILTLYFQQKPDTWSQAQICQASAGWPQFSFDELGGGGTFIPTDLGGWNNLDYTSQGFLLTQDILDKIIGNQDDKGIGIYIQGQDLTFTMVSITVPTESSEQVIYEGNTPFGNGWSYWIQLTDASLFANAKQGEVMNVSISAADMSDGWAQILLKDSGWGDVAGTVKGVDAGTTEIEYPITQELLDVMQSGGIIVGGYNCTVSKIAIK